MMIHNVNVIDHLANGCMGTVVGFNRVDNRVTQVMVEFNNPQCGDSLKTKSETLVNQFGGNSVPIRRAEFEYTLSKNSSTKAKVIQFPLRLSFAATAHKFQGQTVIAPRELILDFRKLRTPSQGYVMLSRVQQMEQLYILEVLPTEKIVPNVKALAECRRMDSVAVNKQIQNWNSSLKLAHMNGQSLLRHIDDLKADSVLIQSDIIFVNETWIPEGFTNEEKFNLPGFQRKLLNVGRGKGIACFYKSGFTPVQEIKQSFFQILKVTNVQTDFISVYRSDEADLNVVHDALQSLVGNKPTIIVGDFNVSLFKYPNNVLTSRLKDLGFQQWVTQPTFDSGSCLDHCYSKLLNAVKVEHHPLYWSLHDALRSSIDL